MNRNDTYLKLLSHEATWAESLDWARALQRLGHDHLDVAAAAETLGAVLKYQEDAERVRRALEAILTR